MENSIDRISRDFKAGYMDVRDVKDSIIEKLEDYSTNYDPIIISKIENLIDVLSKTEQSNYDQNIISAFEGIIIGLHLIEGKFKVATVSPFKSIVLKIQDILLESIKNVEDRNAIIDVINIMSVMELLENDFIFKFFSFLETLDVVERVAVYVNIYDTAVRVFGAKRAYDSLMRDFVENNVIGKSELLEKSVFYDLLIAVFPTYPYYSVRVFSELRDNVKFIRSSQLLKHAINCSIKGKVEDSGVFALELMERVDVDANDLKIVAFLLWIAGWEDEALSILFREEVVGARESWWTVARDSLEKFVLASSMFPADVIKTLVKPSYYSGAGNPIGSVGFMEGRINYMLMMAFLGLGDIDSSKKYASLLLENYNNRFYGLHMQVDDYEFPVALVDVVRVSSGELREAREILKM